MQEPYSFVGWIPCVNGHLDFGLIRPGIRGGLTKEEIKDKKISAISYSPIGQNDNHTRRIALQSWVNWQDERKENGEFRVCLFGEVHEEQDLDNRELIGSVIIYPKGYETVTGKHSAGLLDTIHALGELRNAPHQNWSNQQSKLNQQWEVLQRHIPDSTTQSPFKLVINKDSEPQPNIFRIDFRVRANGLTYLTFHDLNGQKFEHHALTDEDRFVLCRQAFYYIKYSLHVHKHHEHKVDALTSIVPNNTHAGMKLIGQIKRELTGIKRTQLEHKRKHHSAEANGIIGYLQSLQICLLNEKMITKAQYRTETVRLNSLEKSFNAQFARIEDRYNKTQHIATASKQWTTLFLATISLTFLAYINLYGKAQNAISPVGDSAILSLLKQDHAHFLYLPLTALICVLFCYFTAKGYYTVREHHVGFWKKIFRMNIFVLILIMVGPPILVAIIALLLS